MSSTEVMFTHADKKIDIELPYSATNRRLHVIPRIGESVHIMNKSGNYIKCKVTDVIHGYDIDDEVTIEIILVTFDSQS